MARRRRQEEPENHERWLVSYADFITLLFAFFVVMYSISSVNDGKYRVLSNTLIEAFVAPPIRTDDPIQVGEELRSLEPQVGAPFLPQPIQPSSIPTEEVSGSTQIRYRPLEAVEDELSQALLDYVDQGLVKVTRTQRGIGVEMKSSMLFASGSARLSREALKALRKVVLIVKPLSNMINVEGHTDNVPISTISFPSNWELSAARAASVVHYFAKLGVASERMAAIGYGEFRPLASNDTPEGRRRNRRVNLFIMSQQVPDAAYDSEEALDSGGGE
ncbi:flagellar motor protein MotD [Sedimenticola thiotaurini]|uniref:OmpA-like domain-containing protein n=1 Tax=Sedimenticola thiotaurini TaxID=1543721 RepID=A0A0F7JUF6_9GAMM|nr:flagellar motor protein MotD [Sedimenticola thiotaurini]AKH20181.1 hypothetical protein AAY24_07245 [Sedimenticola thiotaurini]